MRLMGGIWRALFRPVTGTSSTKPQIWVLRGLLLGTMPLSSARFFSGIRRQQTPMWMRHLQRFELTVCLLSVLLNIDVFRRDRYSARCRLLFSPALTRNAFFRATRAVRGPRLLPLHTLLLKCDCGVVSNCVQSTSDESGDIQNFDTQISDSMTCAREEGLVVYGVPGRRGPTFCYSYM